MAKQEALKNLSSYAITLNLNIGDFDNCLNTGKYKDAVSGNMALAKGLGMSGVPGFIIGNIEMMCAEDSRNVTGVSAILGAMPFVNFEKEISTVLKN